MTHYTESPSVADHRTHPDTPRARGDRDAPHMSPVTPAEDARTVLINEISWGAVFAGIVLSLIAQLLLNMLGVGIGMATLDPAAGDNPAASTFSITAAVWWTVSGIIAALLGGFAAGRLSGRPKESTTGWHGLIAWAGTTLVIVYLLTTTVGSLVGGIFNTLGGTLSGLTRTAAQTAAPAIAGGADPFGAIERQVRQATGGSDPAALRDAAIAAVRGAMTADPSQQQQAREEAAQALARAQNIPIEQARTQVAQYEQQYRQATQQAAQAASTAATVASTAALAAFLALLLGSLAGYLGGRWGAVDPTITGRGMAARRM